MPSDWRMDLALLMLAFIAMCVARISDSASRIEQHLAKRYENPFE